MYIVLYSIKKALSVVLVQSFKRIYNNACSCSEQFRLEAARKILKRFFKSILAIS